jgi:hypothetical protein
MARYAMTGDATALAKAREVADRYIAEHVNKAPAQDLGVDAVLLHLLRAELGGIAASFTSLTGDKKYLDARPSGRGS